jgi:dihydroorotate dehydrogenase (NAD+) catalytic subunit
MVASGTFGGIQDRVTDCDRLGAVVWKTVTMKPRKGNPPPRVVETASGMLNSIGLENRGLEGFLKEDLPRAAGYAAVLIVSVAGETVEEYGTLVKRLSAAKGIDAFELNISCPNVSHGLDFGTDPAQAEKVARLAKASTDRPVIVKLTPNVTDVTKTAGAALEGGADAVSLINTVKGMAVDWRKGAPVLGGKTGGLSGPAIKPVALRMVWEVCSAFPDAPVVGIGGIGCTDDVLEFLAAGASAVQIGTALFVDPNVCEKILDDLPAKMREAGVTRIADVIGSARK